MIQQTAVQWLKQQYIERGETLPSGVFQEALEMEEHQIIDSYSTGHKDIDNPLLEGTSGDLAKKYYNKKYIMETLKLDHFYRQKKEDGSYPEKLFYMVMTELEDKSINVDLKSISPTDEIPEYEFIEYKTVLPTVKVLNI